jgi:hypothetical protein
MPGDRFLRHKQTPRRRRTLLGYGEHVYPAVSGGVDISRQVQVLLTCYSWTLEILLVIKLSILLWKMVDKDYIQIYDLHANKISACLRRLGLDLGSPVGCEGHTFKSPFLKVIYRNRPVNRFMPQTAHSVCQLVDGRKIIEYWRQRRIIPIHGSANLKKSFHLPFSL